MTAYKEPLFSVLYPGDGDEEDLTLEELLPLISAEQRERAPETVGALVALTATAVDSQIERDAQLAGTLAASAAAAEVEMDWVACDSCQKWRRVPARMRTGGRLTIVAPLGSFIPGFSTWYPEASRGEKGSRIAPFGSVCPGFKT